MLQSAASDLETTEDRLAEKRKSFAETELMLAKLEGEISSWEHTKIGLVSQKSHARSHSNGPTDFAMLLGES